METGCRVGNVEKNLRDRLSLRLDNEVRFDATNMLEYYIPREKWKMVWMPHFCMASTSCKGVGLVPYWCAVFKYRFYNCNRNGGDSLM